MESFFEKYDIVYAVITLIGLAFFPRLSMLLLTAIPFKSMGFLFYLGWIFAPHLTVAILATNWYWNSDYILVIISWIIALGGERTEKKYVQKNISGNKGKSFHFAWSFFSKGSSNKSYYNDGTKSYERIVKDNRVVTELYYDRSGMQITQDEWEAINEQDKLK